MSRVCEISGRGPGFGNKVSHANNKHPRKFLLNLHTRRFFMPSENQWITLKVSSKVLRTIHRLGIEAVLKKYHDIRGKEIK